ncbi:protein-export chaperone SecB [Caulobacter sp. NIBR2454]|uniref:protein-export chaperone SecB n=1 Tax=Caulobacter sp. NIBR2454 TaxID=3015996 RepID=UPI0022B606EF|nr:protein-export chaperone SecB [Caulobacter sp. NIBR2454]
MTDTTSGAPETTAEEQIGVRVIAQFVRDLSFENPGAPEALRGGGQPEIDMGVEMNARGRTDGLFEVDLKLSARATRGPDAVFHVEVVYGGLFQVTGVNEDDLEPVLLIECPRFLFPFARRLIADVTSEGGFPPFLIDPIDFAGVYAQRKAQAGGATVGNA